MKKLKTTNPAVAIVLVAAVWWMAFACSQTVEGGTDSNTHWVACNVVADCPDGGAGYSCEGGKCVPTTDASVVRGCNGASCRDASRAAVDAGAGDSGNVPSLDAGPPPTKNEACAHLFEAESACNRYGSLPPSELARIKARFVASCQDEFELPGETHTAVNVEACAAELVASVCAQGEQVSLKACSFHGSLPSRADCILGSQCTSGSCSGGATYVNGLVVGTCGTCLPVPKAGDSCGVLSDCGEGMTCEAIAGSVPRAPVLACEPYTPIPEGGSQCESLGGFCADGLACSADICEKAIAPGAPCGGVGVACVLPFVCSPTEAGPWTCQPPTGTGSQCFGRGEDGQCATGLGCNANNSCEPIEWKKPGEACDLDLKRCLVGTCQGSTVDGGFVGTCPPVLADSTKCTPSDTCDTFSTCTSDATGGDGAIVGVCEPLAAVRCPTLGAH